MARVKGEGSVHQLADGRWRAQIDLGWRNGKRHRPVAYAATAREAGEKLRDLRNAGELGTLPPPGERVTVEQWMRHWLHNIAKTKVRESTWQRAYQPYVEKRIIPALGKIRLDRLDEDQIEAFYAQLGRNLSAATVLQVHRILSRALKVAMMRRRLGRNPCQSVTAPTYRRPRIVPPTTEETRALLAHAAGRRNGARWTLALTLGLRQGEALGLMWSMVDLDAAALRVEYELGRVAWQHGCVEHCGRTARSCPDRHGGGLMLMPPKSAGSRRDVAMPCQVAELLRAHRKTQRQERLRVGSAWDGWQHNCDRRARRGEVVCPSCRRPTEKSQLVFCEPTGTAIDPRRDWGEWKGMLADLGLPAYRVHDARHFGATMLLEQGVDVRVVQEILGHSSSTLTRDTYQHVTRRLHEDAARKTGEALWGDSPFDSPTAPNDRERSRVSGDVHDLKPPR